MKVLQRDFGLARPGRGVVSPPWVLVCGLSGVVDSEFLGLRVAGDWTQWTRLSPSGLNGASSATLRSPQGLTTRVVFWGVCCASRLVFLWVHSGEVVLDFDLLLLAPRAEFSAATRKGK